MTIVEGFASMTVREGELHFTPFIPEKWTLHAFNIRFRNKIVRFKVTEEEILVENKSFEELVLLMNGTKMKLERNV
jgi:maltose phosphorylase